MANDNLARLPTDSDVDNEEQSAGEQPGFSVIQGGSQGDGQPRATMRVVPKKSGDAESDKPVTVVSNDPNNKTKVTQVDFKQERKGEPQSQPGTVSPFRSNTSPRNTAGDNGSALNAKQNIDQQQTSSNNGSFTKDDALEDQAQKNDQSLSEEQPKSQNGDGESLEQKTEEGDDTQQGQQKKEKEGPVEFAERHKKDYDKRVKERDKAKAKADSPEEVPKTTPEDGVGTSGKASVKAGEEVAEEAGEEATRVGAGAAKAGAKGLQAERAAATAIEGGAGLAASEVASVAGTAAKAGVKAGGFAAKASGALAVAGGAADVGFDVAERKHKIEEASGIGKVTESAKLGVEVAVDVAAAAAETAATVANVAPGVGVAINIAIESAKAVIKSGLDDMAVWLIAICILCLISIVLIPIGFLPLIVLDAFLVGSIIGIRQPMGWMKMTITGVLNAIYLIGIAFWFALFFVVLCNLPGAQWLSTAGNVTSYVPGATYFVPGLEKLQALSQICAKLSLNAGGGGGNVFGGGGGSGGGSCKVITDPTNGCAVSRMQACPAWDAELASQICSLESAGGKNVAVCSGSDVCSDDTSWSCGLFQINMIAHGGKPYMPAACPAGMFWTSGGGIQGGCLERNSNGICVRYKCGLNPGKEQQYQDCRRALADPDVNIKIACGLYTARGNWRDWRNSYNKCTKGSY